MKYLSLIILVGILTAHQAVAQQASAPAPNPGGRLWASDNLNALLDGRMAHAYKAAPQNMEGQPFFQKTWQPGEIIFAKTKQRIGNIKLRYDTYGHQILAVPQKGRADTLLLNQNKIEGFVVQDELFPDRVHTFRRFSDAPRRDQEQEYVEVLHEGKYTLLKRHGRHLYRSEEGKVFNNGRHYDRLVEHISYFLGRPDGTAVPVKLNTKSIITAAPDLAAAIKTELERLPVAVKTESQMVTLLAHVDKGQ